MTIKALLSDLSSVYPADQISTNQDQLRVVSRDESTLTPAMPAVVVWPQNSEQIAKTIRLCADSQIPVTCRGAGSALEGSTIPSESGLVLDLSKMTKIIDFWPEDLQITVEPGLVYDKLNEHLKCEGLFFPPSPGGSGDIATIGGMVSTNASGIYSVKYGGSREYVLALDIVTGNGESMRIGNRAVKRSSGYNLVDLISGSEGTLAVITAITLRLAGIPESRLRTAYFFEQETAATAAVSEMRRYGIDLAAVEFLDRFVIKALNDLKDFDLKEQPSLFLEFHGPEVATKSNSKLAESVCKDSGGTELVLPKGRDPWEIRHWVTEAIKQAMPGYTIVRNDVAFPISKLSEMVAYCHELGATNNLEMFTFGHVGMGLLHALILARSDNKTEWDKAQKVNELIISRAVELDGTISGEHGIGLGHKKQFNLEHGKSIELMRGIKRQFDPQGILNPGKIFDLL